MSHKHVNPIVHTCYPKKKLQFNKYQTTHDEKTIANLDSTLV